MALKVAVTGGSGFIGRAVVHTLLAQNYDVVSLQRSKLPTSNAEIRYLDLEALDEQSLEVLSDIDVVVHTAALVHKSKADANAHNTLNFKATKRLVDAAKKHGVKKFVFLSTVGVYGVSSAENILSTTSATDPISFYAKAKLQSENHLLENAGDMAVSIIRLPLVFGANAPGNYGALERLAKKKMPLPFGGVHNKRSLVSVDIAAKEIAKAATNLNAHLGIQLLAENKTYSTEELITTIRRDHNVPNWLVVVPKSLMKLLLTVLGKQTLYEQLYEDLVFESSI